MEKKEKLILYSIIIILILALFYSNTKTKSIKEEDKFFPIDTSYNKIVLDSIDWNIQKKDSIIYNIKTEMQDEIKNSFELDNSSAIKLFYKLCTDE